MDDQKRKKLWGDARKFAERYFGNEPSVTVEREFLINSFASFVLETQDADTAPNADADDEARDWGSVDDMEASY